MRRWERPVPTASRGDVRIGAVLVSGHAETNTVTNSSLVWPAVLSSPSNAAKRAIARCRVRPTAEQTCDAYACIRSTGPDGRSWVDRRHRTDTRRAAPPPTKRNIVQVRLSDGGEARPSAKSIVWRSASMCSIGFDSIPATSFRAPSRAMTISSIFRCRAFSLRRCPFRTIWVRVMDATDRISVRVFSPAGPARKNHPAQNIATSNIDSGAPDKSAVRPAMRLPNSLRRLSMTSSDP